MMDLKKKVVALDSDLEKKGSLPQGVNENKKCCSDCKTTETPLWRGGPAGPKSLCNACGIRYRKKGIPIVTLGEEPKTKRKREKRCGSSTSTITTTSTTKTTVSATTSTTTAKATVGSGGRDLSESLKVELVAGGNKVFLQEPPQVVKEQIYQRYQRRYQRRRELGEVEQAAVCLLAMSCDSVFG